MTRISQKNTAKNNTKTDAKNNARANREIMTNFIKKNALEIAEILGFNIMSEEDKTKFMEFIKKFCEIFNNNGSVTTIGFRTNLENIPLNMFIFSSNRNPEIIKLLKIIKPDIDKFSLTIDEDTLKIMNIIEFGKIIMFSYLSMLIFHKCNNGNMNNDIVLELSEKKRTKDGSGHAVVIDKTGNPLIIKAFNAAIEKIKEILDGKTLLQILEEIDGEDLSENKTLLIIKYMVAFAELPYTNIPAVTLYNNDGNLKKGIVLIDGKFYMVNGDNIDEIKIIF